MEIMEACIAYTQGKRYLLSIYPILYCFIFIVNHFIHAMITVSIPSEIKRVLFSLNG